MGGSLKMSDNKDDIIVRRVGGSKVKPEKNNNDKNDNKNEANNFEKQFNRNLRIVSILVFVFSLLVIISLVSYTPKDELNTQLSAREILGVIKGNDEIVSRIETTHNWLGIFGAIISNWVFNSTFGYAAIVLPIILIIASIQVFFKKSLTEKSLKYFFVTLVIGLLGSSLMGTLTKVSWMPEVSKEWSGSIGQFLSSITISFIGNIGSFIVFFSLLILTVVFFTPFNIAKTIEFLRPYYQKIADAINSFKAKFIKTDEKPEEKNSDLNKNIDNEDEEDLDPAVIITANRAIENSKIKINKNAMIDSEIIPNLPKKPIIITEAESLEISDDLSKPKVKINRNTEINNAPNNINTESEQAIPIVVESIQKPIKDYKPDIIIEENELAQDDNISEINTKKPLTVYVQNPEIEDDEVPVDFLSTYIHDEAIKYEYPTKELLVSQFDVEDFIDEEELKSNAKILQEKLETFRIFIEDLNVTPGPVVTQYEFVPAAGIKISRIASLADDISMALKARGIRIIAPIPGRGTVGIEIPNKNPSLVRFSSIISSAKFSSNTMRLPLALGKTINGEVFCTDLAKMPHLLMAGATGSGKSVGINTIISSLIYRKHPSEIKFVIIDPKKVELRQYAMLENHFIASCPDVEDLIITDPSDAVITLKSVCAEMDQRYDILAEVSQRNIVDYNQKVKDGAFKNDKRFNHRALPYIVVIIDELADLMLTASKEVETPIIRIAQLARAVGIHLVIATQRPSVDVITGIIKANFPARIAFQVASKIDSRTILDTSGAEQLLGNGDMLFLSGGSPKPIRMQNSFLSTDEVESICNYIGEQKGYSKPYMLPSIQEKGGDNLSIDPSDRDELFEDAARLVIRQQQASVSMLQRRLKVGYARAGRIVDELEAAGIVGPYDGSKARTVLYESESYLEAIL